MSAGEWDQHPLTREKVSERAPVAVIAKRDGVAGWSIVLLGNAPLSADDARQLAAELNDMADIVEGKRW